MNTESASREKGRWWLWSRTLSWLNGDTFYISSLYRAPSLLHWIKVFHRRWNTGQHCWLLRDLWQSESCDAKGERYSLPASSFGRRATSLHPSLSSDGHSLIMQWDATSVPAIFNAAFIRFAFWPPAYIQLLLSFFALMTFKDNLLVGWHMAYVCSNFLILESVFPALFNAVCFRTGICLRKSVIRTVVPTGCDTRWELQRAVSSTVWVNHVCVYQIPDQLPVPPIFDGWSNWFHSDPGADCESTRHFRCTG